MGVYSDSPKCHKFCRSRNDGIKSQSSHYYTRYCGSRCPQRACLLERCMALTVTADTYASVDLLSCDLLPYSGIGYSKICLLPKF